jgi:cytoskeletal protein RodZ
MINKAELGDYLYYIIFAIIIVASLFEKITKAKKQQQNTPPVPQPYDDFEDVDEPQQQQPQTIEEILKRMMQTDETSEREEEFAGYREEAQSLEVIPAPCFSYQPVVTPIEQDSDDAFSPMRIEEENRAGELFEYEFDIRQAVIANEILNRKY